MDILLDWYSEFLKLSQNNPAIAGFIGIWVAGLTGWFLKDLPSMVKIFIIRECFTTLIISERGDMWSRTDEKVQFKNFFKWVAGRSLSNLIRIFNVDHSGEKWIIIPGLGVNFFIFDKRLYWFDKIEIQGSGQTTFGITYYVRITTYGRNPKSIIKIFDEFKNLHETESTNLVIKDLDGRNYYKIQDLPNKDLDKIFINKNTYNELIETFEQFDIQLERCKQLQTSHRLTILLEGPTGTGKTTLIKALANYLNKSIFLMEPTDLLKNNLSTVFSNACKTGIVVIEDIDSLSTIKSRGDFVNEDSDIDCVDERDESTSSKKGILTKIPEPKKEIDFYDLAGGLSKVLNNLDGVIEYNESIIIMTTNDVSSIDPALLRPGRIDKIIHVGWLNKETIIENFKKFYSWQLSLSNPNVSEHYFSDLDKLITVNSISGAKLSNIFKFAKDHFDAIEKINKE